eukprot:Blabericola_migrator_1__5353@NODE_2744_length_2399_cov_33_951544_g1718_i0_p2_GENE_NODE_2744_length_2399_cov_33_951544_g1718_i0NODE_2744_length_2399_cov_33_951544_g1718_i0_p2_ORF_typecomplete_len155_score7_49Ribosomal_S21/PF01165_20/3_NODE_2744_length_2399_cov_33_951544_g1718_i018512315
MTRFLRLEPTLYPKIHIQSAMLFGYICLGGGNLSVEPGEPHAKRRAYTTSSRKRQRESRMRAGRRPLHSGAFELFEPHSRDWLTSFETCSKEVKLAVASRNHDSDRHQISSKPLREQAWMELANSLSRVMIVSRLNMQTIAKPFYKSHERGPAL